jgi:Helix-turn-helix domain
VQPPLRANLERAGLRRMSRRRIDPRRVKIHRNYTVEEVAALLGTHKNTIRNWLKRGLPAVDRKRPTLIFGLDLVVFLDTRRKKIKQTCGPGRIYCVRCREPKEPAGRMVDFLPLTVTSGNLRGICPSCDTLIHRRVSIAKLDIVCADLEVTYPHRHLRLGESPSLSLHCDSHQETEADADA